MPSGEETLLDVPATPAPLFAYRALRAAFWGEEATPERASGTSALIVKEPVKDVKQAQISATTSIQFVPGQKRQHAAVLHLSPTKSILRTPGAHTPRRALLKDISVKFKDIRKSISPEIRGKRTTPSEQTLRGDAEKENRPFLSATKSAADTHAVKNANKSISSQPSETLQVSMEKTFLRPKSTAHKDPDVSVPDGANKSIAGSSDAEVALSFDADAFMRNTEIEMKKLIKYGQKMREYARRQDEENNKLRLLLDQVRDENKRLHNELDKSRSGKGNIDKEHRIASGQQLKEDMRKQAISAPALMVKSPGKSNNSSDDKKSKPEILPVGFLDDGRDNSKRSRMVVAAARSQPSDIGSRSNNNNKRTLRDLNADASANTPPDPFIHIDLRNQHFSTTTSAVSASASALATDRQVREPEAGQEPSRAKKQRHDHSDSRLLSPRKQGAASTSTLMPTQQHRHQHQQHLPLRPLANGTNSSRLAPDRLAAARARVRKRAELRKASAELDGDEDQIGSTDPVVRDVGISQTGHHRYDVGDGRNFRGEGTGNGNGNVNSSAGAHSHSDSKVNTSLVDWIHL